jgi:hypothetical protein
MELIGRHSRLISIHASAVAGCERRSFLAQVIHAPVREMGEK